MSKEYTQLATIDHLVQDGQPIFGVFHKVKDINYLDYHSYLLSNRAVSQWRKQLRANQFAFLQVVQPPYRVCVAIATLNWITTAFCYLYNEETNEMQIVEGLQPFTRNSEFNQSTYTGVMSFRSGKIKVDISFFETQITLGVISNVVNMIANCRRSYDPLAMCAETGKGGWTFTQKEPLFEITGELQLANSDEIVDLSGATAMLDWSLGYMRRITTWYWSSIATILTNGKQFGLNLATGVNETGVNENACWYDGKRYHLPSVVYRRGKGEDVWYIANQPLNWSNVVIDITFTPLQCYEKHDRYFIVDSIFEQWVGYYCGIIILDGEEIVLDKVLGLAEDHYAKW